MPRIRKGAEVLEAELDADAVLPRKVQDLVQPRERGRVVHAHDLRARLRVAVREPDARVVRAAFVHLRKPAPPLDHARGPHVLRRAEVLVAGRLPVVPAADQVEPDGYVAAAVREGEIARVAPAHLDVSRVVRGRADERLHLCARLVIHEVFALLLRRVARAAIGLAPRRLRLVPVPVVDKVVFLVQKRGDALPRTGGRLHPKAARALRRGNLDSSVPLHGVHFFLSFRLHLFLCQMSICFSEFA